VGYIEDAVDGLHQGPVYVDSSASLSGSSDIASALDGDHVAVVALPDVAFDTYSANDVANQIRSAVDGDYATVIVVVDGVRDSFGVSSSGDAAAIATALNGANTGDGGQAIQVVTGQLVDASDGGSGLVGEAVGLGGGLLGLALIGSGAVLAYRRWFAHGFKRSKTEAFAKLPAELRTQVDQLWALLGKHHSAGLGSLEDEILALVGNAEELFVRIDKRGTGQQGRIAAVEYADTFAKLNRALGEDYYLDILRRPDLWNDSDRRLAEVREALDATGKQLVENIRQVNASQDLEFQVALESLVGSMNTPSIESAYGKTELEAPSSNEKEETP
jgi:hypothetical protein